MQQIADVVEDFVSQNRMFTSVDVANEVKYRGTWVRNRDVAEYLRTHVQLDTDGDYESCLIEVTLGDGSTVPAYVYHPYGEDPPGYLNRNQRALVRPAFEALMAAKKQVVAATQPAPQPTVAQPVAPHPPAHVIPSVSTSDPKPSALSRFMGGFKWPKLSR